MVKLVYTLGLGSNSNKRVGVQIPFSTSYKVYSSEVEQWTFNPMVLGSSPSILKNILSLNG